MYTARMGGEATTVTPGVVAGPVKWAGVGALVTLALGATVAAFLSRTPGQVGESTSAPAKAALVTTAVETSSAPSPLSKVVMDEPSVRPPVSTPRTVPVVVVEPLGPPAPSSPLLADPTPASLAPARLEVEPTSNPASATQDPKVDAPRVTSSTGTSPSTPKATPTKPSSPSGPASLVRLININTASQSELELLPRIGPAMATRIIEYRDQHGPFRRAEDLDRVKGIGPKTLEKLLPLVTTGE